MENTGAFADSIYHALGHLYDVTRRRQKTNVSILQKLRRERTELSQMQDIAGSRVVVPTINDLLHHALDEVSNLSTDVKIVDRLANPRNGYRAIHAILKNGWYSFETQLRTRLQHAWAELSEKLADRHGIDLKYGGGPQRERTFLTDLSKDIASFEALELDSIPEYVSTSASDTDPLALEGSPELRERRGAILARIEGAMRFLRD